MLDVGNLRRHCQGQEHPGQALQIAQARDLGCQEEGVGGNSALCAHILLSNNHLLGALGNRGP
eukprot:1394804-Lingulodinium_polyedra.AAC.1